MQVDSEENVEGMQNMKYRRVEKQQEGRGALYFCPRFSKTDQFYQ